MSINEKASFPFYSFIKSYKQDPLTIRNYHFIISFIVLGYPFISMKEILTVSICIGPLILWSCDRDTNHSTTASFKSTSRFCLPEHSAVREVVKLTSKLIVSKCRGVVGASISSSRFQSSYSGKNSRYFLHYFACVSMIRKMFTGIETNSSYYTKSIASQWSDWIKFHSVTI